MNPILWTISLFLFLFVSCKSTVENKAQKIVDESISKHGWNAIEGKDISFIFRKSQYTLSCKNYKISYFKTTIDSAGNVYSDTLRPFDKKFNRFLNENAVSLDSSEIQKYSNSLNSVMYFFQLPYRLNDPAVIKEYLGTESINKQVYEKIKITFKKENGGNDFEDEFLYWFHQQDKTLDFLAYKYLTNNGGTRFRVATNRRNIEGFLIQDYINYKPATKFIALDSLPLLYQKNELEKLSEINNLNVEIKSFN